MHSTSKVDPGRGQTEQIEEMVKKSRRSGTLTYTPNKVTPRKIAAAGKSKW
jgi:hypothetical protein